MTFGILHAVREHVCNLASWMDHVLRLKLPHICYPSHSRSICFWNHRRKKVRMALSSPLPSWFIHQSRDDITLPGMNTNLSRWYTCGWQTHPSHIHIHQRWSRTCITYIQATMFPKSLKQFPTVMRNLREVATKESWIVKNLVWGRYALTQVQSRTVPKTISLLIIRPKQLNRWRIWWMLLSTCWLEQSHFNQSFKYRYTGLSQPQR